MKISSKSIFRGFLFLNTSPSAGYKTGHSGMYGGLSVPNTNKGMQKLLQYYRDTFPNLMAKQRFVDKEGIRCDKKSLSLES